MTHIFQRRAPFMGGEAGERCQASYCCGYWLSQHLQAWHSSQMCLLQLWAQATLAQTPLLLNVRTAPPGAMETTKGPKGPSPLLGT